MSSDAGRFLSPGRSEAGDTLIEVLLALVVLGLASVAILLAFSTSIFGSAEHRSLVTTDTVLRSAAESATNQIQQQSNSNFQLCSNNVMFTAATGYALPSGYTAQVSAKFWNGTTFSATCTPYAPQLLTVTVGFGGNSYAISTVIDDLLPRPVPNPGVGAQLVFSQQPGSGVSANALSVQPVVSVLNSSGNLATLDFSPVTLTITANTGTSGATLSSSCQGTESYGVVTFSNCSVAAAGTNYTLTATDPALTSPSSSAISNPFTVTAGPATQLVFSTAPGNGSGGTPLPTQPAVTVEDAYGNTVTTDTSSVTMVIAANPGNGTLACNADPAVAAAGIATFKGCAINKAGAGYTLTASDGTLTTATSGTFNITAGPATQLVFTTSPSSGTSATALSTQPAVTVEDAYGNTVTTDTSSVTVVIAANPGNGTLACNANPAVAASGIAAFNGCAINKTGAGYTLTASDGTLTSATSGTFNITAGPATQLVFTTSPSNGTGSTILPTQPVISVEDAGGNVVSSSTASITIATNSGTGTLACTTNPVAAAAGGVAAFAGCRITLGTQGSFALKATASGLTTGISSSFTVAGPATQLIFRTSPGNTSGGGAFVIQPVVLAADSSGDVVTASATSVTVAIASGTGTLACTTNPVAAAGGVASFAGCKITLGTQGTFTLSAVSSGLATGASSSFTVSP